MKRDSRPRNLSLPALLFELRLPIPGWVSILHRVSGVFLFAATLWMLWLFERSVSSEEEFDAVREIGASPFGRAILSLLIWSYCHHFLAGLRFLCLDLGKGLDLGIARASGAWVLGIGVVFALAASWVIW